MSDHGRQVQAGNADRAAEFEAQALPLSRVLFATAYRIIGDRTLAEDMVQEAYIRAWEKYDQFQAGTNFKAWIFQILVFLCRNASRSKARQPSTAEQIEVLAGGIEDTAPLPALMPGMDWKRLYTEFVDDEFKQSLDLLDPDNRTVLLLVGLGGLSYQECADALGMPLGTVMSRLFRARKQLQADLHSYARERGLLRASPPAVTQPAEGGLA